MTELPVIANKIKQQRRGRRRQNRPNTLNNNEPMAMVRLGPRGFPRRMEVVHNYKEIITITSTGYTGYAFSTNGMYDPNISGTGHQPMLFDQMTTLYDHYHVMSSELKATFWTTQSANLVLYIDDDTSAATSLIQAMESSGSVSALQLQNNARPVVLRKRWDAKKYFGGDILDNTQLQGTSGANPTEQSNFVIGVAPYDGATSTNAYVTVEIVYRAIWTELATLPTS